VKTGRPKYRNRPTEWNGRLYASASEAERARTLELLLRAGRIEAWRHGERTLILDSGPGQRCWYTPDFVVTELGGLEVAEDVKGAVPRDFRMRAILYEMATGIALRVVDKDGTVRWTPAGNRGGRRNARRDVPA
jgi:hypothetical protein